MTEPFYADKFSRIFHADSRVLLPTMKTEMFDSVVTDPPYELGFMGKAWDKSGVAYDVPFWREVLRVAKPGAHLLAFGGTRTFHRLMVAIEDAGWEIRDTIMWCYGSGFPKSLDVSKAIDKAAGAERARNVVPNKRSKLHGDRPWMNDPSYRFESNVAVTDEAAQWDGWGTALKPAWEPIIVARKPLDGTVAANVLKHGTGGINVDGCRIETAPADALAMERANSPGSGRFHASQGSSYGRPTPSGPLDTSKGRWPANLIHDGSEEVVGLFPESEVHDGGSKGGFVERNASSLYELGHSQTKLPPGRGDSGSAARFFYCAKPSARERKHGLAFEGVEGSHTTVKPLALMSYLVRLVTRPDGLVLDPFLGSGTTRLACRAEGMRCVGIEQDEGYCRIAAARG